MAMTLAIQTDRSRSWPLLGAALLSVVALGGCASHAFVRDNLAVVDGRVTTVEGTARSAMERANAAHKLAEGKFQFETILSDDSIKFARNDSVLSPEAEARLNELATRLKGENRNVYIEIQGHTESRERNTALGQARAESVRRYLARQGIALNRMATISYGADVPLSQDPTPDARAQNRRVVILVLG